MAKAPPPRNASDLGLQVLIPAYILSELKTGFQIGAMLFLPFLVIDLVVASVTLSIGMVQLPPVMISAPFKILLFVLVDGWNLVVGSLVKSFLLPIGLRNGRTIMTPETAVHIIRGALMAAFNLSAPLLLIGFGVGVIMNLIQVATSLQDSAFSTFPRLAAFLTGFIVLMPWMLKQMVGYTVGVFTDIAKYGH